MHGKWVIERMSKQEQENGVPGNHSKLKKEGKDKKAKDNLPIIYSFHWEHVTLG